MVNRILSAGPIPKRLVAFQFTPAEQVQLIKEMLMYKSKQEAARGLGPGDASKFIDLLDSVCPLPSFTAANILQEIGSGSE